MTLQYIYGKTSNTITTIQLYTHTTVQLCNWKFVDCKQFRDLVPHTMHSGQMGLGRSLPVFQKALPPLSYIPLRLCRQLVLLKIEKLSFGPMSSSSLEYICAIFHSAKQTVYHSRASLPLVESCHHQVQRRGISLIQESHRIRYEQSQNRILDSNCEVVLHWDTHNMI